MSKREVLSIALKIMGVYFLLQGLSSTPMALAMLFSTGLTEGSMTVGFMLGSGLYLGAALILVIWGDAIAGRLADPEGMEPRPPAVDRAGLQRVGFSVLGLWAMLTSLGPIVGQLTALFASESAEEASRLARIARYQSFDWTNFAGPFALFLAGLFLLIGSQGLVNLLRRARNAGHPKPE